LIQSNKNDSDDCTLYSVQLYRYLARYGTGTRTAVDRSTAVLYEYMYSCSSTGTVLLYSRTVPVQLYVQLHGSMYDATRSGAPVGDHRFRKFTVNNDSFLLDA
jgi:hypothetical protein